MIWVPDVSIRAGVGEMPDDDIADVADIPGIDSALCGVTLPTATPPPSKALADPNIVDGAVPMVEQAVLPMLDENAWSPMEPILQQTWRQEIGCPEVLMNRPRCGHSREREGTALARLKDATDLGRQPPSGPAGECRRLHDEQLRAHVPTGEVRG